MCHLGGHTLIVCAFLGLIVLWGLDPLDAAHEHVYMRAMCLKFLKSPN